MNLPAFKNDTPEGEVVTCWELSFEDVEKIIKSRKIWMMQTTFNTPLQPILIQADSMLTFHESGADGQGEADSVPDPAEGGELSEEEPNDSPKPEGK